METKILGTTTEEIDQAAQILSAGGLVAFPTETVYGLGADALNEKAVAKVYAAKGRPSDNPMIVHISSKDDLSMLTVEITEDMEKLSDRFWPRSDDDDCKKAVDRTRCDYRRTGYRRRADALCAGSP